MTYTELDMLSPLDNEMLEWYEQNDGMMGQPPLRAIQALDVGREDGHLIYSRLYRMKLLKEVHRGNAMGDYLARPVRLTEKGRATLRNIAAEEGTLR